MNVNDILSALALPPDSSVDRRVPKKMLAERGDFTAADRRQILEQIEELRWVAALKPNHVGAPVFRDDLREILEIAVLTVQLRPNARAPKLIELIHRAIPYPLVLVAQQEESLTLSLADKRSAQNDAARVVLDGEVLCTPVDDHPATAELLTSLPVTKQPRADLWAVYRGWVTCLEAFLAARLTGRYALSYNAASMATRREALAACERLDREIAALRKQADRETQVSRRVDLNLQLQRLEAERIRALADL